MPPRTRRQRAQAAHESEEIAQIQVEKELLNPDDVETEQENDENIFVSGDRDNEDEEADENSFSFPMLPPPRSLANPLRTPSHEDALRDITDEFFHPPSPSPIKAVPAFARLKPPRRPKKPKSLAFPHDPPNWQPTSPLPPSSPLASTSTYGPQNYASTSHANAYEYNMTAFYRHAQEIEPRTSDSDPFGFFAAEKVLKERRAARLPSEKRKHVQSPVSQVTPYSTRTRAQLNRTTPTPTRPASSVPIPTNDEDIDDLYLDEPITTSMPVPALILRHSYIPTPSSSPASLRSEIVVPVLLKPRLDILRDQPTRSRDPLRTPRKRKRDFDATTPASSDIVSSPSPVKISVAIRRPQTPSDRQETAEEYTPIPKRTTRAQAKGKGKAHDDALKPRRRVRAAKEDASLSPRQACKDLEKLLPRRATTRRAAAVAKAGGKGRVRMAVDPVVSDSDSDDEQPKRRKPASRAKPASSPKPASRSAKAVLKGAKKSPLKSGKPRSKGKEKAKPLDDLMEMSDDTRKRYEEERLARLEYFRKLDDYQMKKENVYVV
ncbi:hypothetical protein DEU56DRAFT_878987 [Suillus clintonianus]|uniref:uncharacterized protein n=1 Tax=Suillus clintonianus TaxID=1904413 RepID=UPI001B86440F|nr:uncharacterized protein DEU56DRAFT_878987 [Suillus clintonianus]KAG2153229.1 hypothetical protein DEU56DRAFT_878987 [Suillus clintonianus]